MSIPPRARELMDALICAVIVGAFWETLKGAVINTLHDWPHLLYLAGVLWLMIQLGRHRETTDPLKPLNLRRLIEKYGPSTTAEITQRLYVTEKRIERADAALHDVPELTLQNGRWHLKDNLDRMLRRGR